MRVCPKCGADIRGNDVAITDMRLKMFKVYCLKKKIGELLL